MMSGLAGKVALVTGGSSGIGRASAQAFAREGAKVVVVDVDIEGGEETVRTIAEAGGEAAFVEADVSRGADVEAMVRTVVEIYGCLDYAHNNAGFGLKASVTDCTEEQWDAVIRTNLKGVWLCMKYELPQMLGQGAGAIVNTSSVCGLVGWSDLSAYVAAKHGVIGLTKTAALEYATAGIRVNAVCPGVIRTPPMERGYRDNPQAEAEHIVLHPMGRLGLPEEVAQAVVWLCSDAASFVTGHALVIDGGLVAR